MTRVNVIPVEELSDQWLLAEYHELPRCIKQDIDTKDAPPHYKLGKGHMKWAKKHSLFLLQRYSKLCQEINYRGFKVNYLADKFWHEYIDTIKPDDKNDYTVSTLDNEVNKGRLIGKYKLKPSYYKWTKRDKPWFIKVIDNPDLLENKLINLKDNPGLLGTKILTLTTPYCSKVVKTNDLRFLIRNGEKVLQQKVVTYACNIGGHPMKEESVEWRDIKEIKDE